MTEKKRAYYTLYELFNDKTEDRLKGRVKTLIIPPLTFERMREVEKACLAGEEKEHGRADFNIVFILAMIPLNESGEDGEEA